MALQSYCEYIEFIAEEMRHTVCREIGTVFGFVNYLRQVPKKHLSSNEDSVRQFVPGNVLASLRHFGFSSLRQAMQLSLSLHVLHLASAPPAGQGFEDSSDTQPRCIFCSLSPFEKHCASASQITLYLLLSSILKQSSCSSVHILQMVLGQLVYDFGSGAFQQRDVEINKCRHHTKRMGIWQHKPLKTLHHICQNVCLVTATLLLVEERVYCSVPEGRQSIEIRVNSLNDGIELFSFHINTNYLMQICETRWIYRKYCKTNKQASDVKESSSLVEELHLVVWQTVQVSTNIIFGSVIAVVVAAVEVIIVASIVASFIGYSTFSGPQNTILEHLQGNNVINLYPFSPCGFTVTKTIITQRINNYVQLFICNVNVFVYVSTRNLLLIILCLLKMAFY
uniref:Uncharacterized protein n=1 Tax=Glossina palpalis gambiensis TaxID=67801 RepID=A0A1B0BG18_9MUSC